MNSKVYILDENAMKLIINGQKSKTHMAAIIGFLGFALMSKVAIDFSKEIKEKDETIENLEDVVRTLDAKLNHPNPEWNGHSDV